MTPTSKKTTTRTPVVTAESTDVSGYFNSNSWPVSLTISALGRTFTVPPGKFVVDQSGRKINDPIFESYVGPMQLSREWSTGGTVAINQVMPATPTVAPTNPVSEAASLKRDRFGNVSGAVMRPPTLVPVVPGNVVVGMTVDEARRKGFIRPTTVPNEDAPVDTAGAPVSNAMVPELDYARDIKANAARRAANLTVPAVERVEDADAAAAATRLTEALGVGLPEPVTAPPVPPTLPAPDLGDAGASQPTKKFVCSVDGKQFDFRSHLKKYATRKYPDQVDAIMAPYPEQRAAAASTAG